MSENKIIEKEEIWRKKTKMKMMKYFKLVPNQ